MIPKQIFHKQKIDGKTSLKVDKLYRPVNIQI